MLTPPALSERLSRILSLIPQDARVADIGTDHGYLPLHLIIRGTEKVICCDVAAEPLEKARRNLRRFGYTADFRLGDGLACVAPGEADYIVIAGMGGETIAKILENSEWPRGGHTYILQPMSKGERLCGYLSLAGYTVTGQFIVSEKGRLRTVLVCKYV